MARETTTAEQAAKSAIYIEIVNTPNGKVVAVAARVEEHWSGLFRCRMENVGLCVSENAQV